MSDIHGSIKNGNRSSFVRLDKGFAPSSLARLSPPYLVLNACSRVSSRIDGVPHNVPDICRGEESSWPNMGGLRVKRAHDY